MSEPIRQYWENRLENNYNLKGVGFYRAGISYNYWVYRMRKKQFLDQFKKLLIHKPNPVVLEIGPGTGFYTDLMLQEGVMNITVCDITSVATKELARKYPGIKTFTNDIGSKECSLPPNQFDIILCLDVLFHITDGEAYKQALKNINGFLKEDGIAIFTENFCPVHTFRGHITDRTAEEIVNAFGNADFSITYCRPMFYFLNPPVNQTSKILWGLSNIRIVILSFFEKSKLGFLNHIPGLFLYCTDRVLFFSGLRGFGSALLLCKQSTPLKKYAGNSSRDPASD